MLKKDDIILCKRPIYIYKVKIVYGCGKCLACRIKQKRIWVARMLAEKAVYQDNTLVTTLTYDDINLPKNKYGEKTLSILDYQKFIKRLRKQTDKMGIKFKYFIVGEYGTKGTERPHYHCIFFGLSPDHTELVKRAWGLGLIHFDTNSTKAIKYVAGYVTKKMVDVRQSSFQTPEFKRCSQGFGLSYIIKNLDSFKNLGTWAKYNDAPLTLSFEGETYPMGRYLRTKLRAIVNGIISSLDYIIQELKNKSQRLMDAWVNSGMQQGFRDFMGEIARPYMEQLEYKNLKLMLKSRSIT